VPRIKLSPLSLLGIAVAIATSAFLILNLPERKQSSRRTRVQSEVAALSTALESYKAEYGNYPQATGPIGPNETANANILYLALVVSNSAYNPRGKIFFEPYKGICASTNYTSTANYFVDPFGQPYQYRYPGDPQKSGTNFFDLFSYSKSRKTADTSNNWETWVKNW
jgi:type II secretory pathway pseudopilin PulG